MVDPYGAFKTLDFDRRDTGVLVVTLNRPDVLNAMTSQMHAEIVDLWRAVGEDAGVRSVVVTGAGRAFCAGNDLRQPPIGPTDRSAVSRRIHQMVYGMLRLDRPIVAAINGAAAGIGLALALAADVTIAAEDAPLIDGQVRIGVASGEHSVLLWPLLCGLSQAKYWLLSGETLTGKDAERIGLVTRARPAGEVLDEALDIAERLAAGSRPAIAGTKLALNHWLMRAQPAFEVSTALEMIGTGSPDAAEGRSAMLDRRVPAFPSARP